MRGGGRARDAESHWALGRHRPPGRRRDAAPSLHHASQIRARVQQANLDATGSFSPRILLPPRIQLVYQASPYPVGPGFIVLHNHHVGMLGFALEFGGFGINNRGFLAYMNLDDYRPRPVGSEVGIVGGTSGLDPMPFR